MERRPHGSVDLKVFVLAMVIAILLICFSIDKEFFLFQLHHVDCKQFIFYALVFCMNVAAFWAYRNWNFLGAEKGVDRFDVFIPSGS